MPHTFESDEYRSRLQAIEDALKEKQEHAFSDLAETANSQQIKLFRTPSGFAFAPMKDNEVVGPDEFEKLPPEERKTSTNLVRDGPRYDKLRAADADRYLRVSGLLGPVKIQFSQVYPFRF